MTFIQLFLNLTIFLFLSLVFFYLPGFWFIKKVKEHLEDQEILALSFSISLIFFLLVAIVLGLANLRLLTLPIILLAGILVIFKYQKSILSPWKIFLRDKLFLMLVLLGILTMGFINFPSGLKYKGDLLFWSSQGYDGTWHIALMEEIKKDFPPKSPIFAGENLSNYHYFADLVMGEYYRILPFFSPWDLYFRFFPIIFSFMIITSVFSFLSRWQGSRTAGYLGILFTVFTGSFGYIVNYLRSGNIFGGETVFWAAQLNTIIGNPPHAISLSLMTSSFLALLLYQIKRNKFWLIICGILVGFLSGFKVSAGVTVLAGLGLASLAEILFNRKFSFLILTVVVGFLNALVFKSITKEGSSLLIWQPWWAIHSMVQSSDRLGLVDWEHKRQHYLAKGTWQANMRIMYLEGLSFLIFFAGNLGIRIIGLSKIFALRSSTELTMLGVLLSGLTIPVLFVQKGVAFNSMQFMQYFLLVFGFLAAAGTYQIIKLTKNKLLNRALVILIILLAMPTVIGNLLENYAIGRTAISKISNEELSALAFLKANSDPSDIVLTSPYEFFPKQQFFSLPKPAYVWFPTPYVAAVSSRRTFLAAEEMATQTGFPVVERLDKVKRFFLQKDDKKDLEFLKENSIKYIYAIKSEVRSPLNKNYLDVFFENNEAILFKVKN